MSKCIQEIYVKVYKGQLDGLEKIEETAITIMEQQMSNAQKEKEQSRIRQLALVTRKEQARRWQQLQEEGKRLRQELTQIESLLAQSEQIEYNVARLATLQTVISPLILIRQKQVESNRLQQTIKQDGERATILAATLQAISEAWQKGQRQIEATRICYQQQDQEHKTVQADLLTIQVPCNEIARLQGKQHEYQELSKSVSTFASDIEQQQQYLKNKLDEMSRIETAIPLLQLFAHFRQEWQRATQDLDKVTQERHQHSITQKENSTQLQILQETRETIRGEVSFLQSEVASQKTLLIECQKRSKRFHSIEGEATCSYCGQLLTKKHLIDERQHIQGELQESERCLQQCTIRYDAALKQQETVEQEIERAQQEEQQHKQTSETLIQQYNSIIRRRDTAYTEAKNRLELLKPEYLERMQGINTTFIDVDACILAIYPTSHDLDILALHLQDKPALNQKLHVVESDLAQRQELCRKQAYILSEIEPLLQTYPPEHARTLLEKWEQARQRERKLSEAVKKLSSEIRQQEQQISVFVDEERQAREEQAHLAQKLAIARTNVENAQQTIAEIQEQLPAEWQEQIPHLSPKTLAAWQQEIEALQGARKQHQALLEARQHLSQFQHALAAVESEQRQIPEEAQCMPEQVQEEISQINALYQELEKKEQRSRTEVQRLQGIMTRLQELQRQWAEATRLTSRYKDLASLLGREGLQHYLLQNAEAGIVYYANEMLDRISGGTLRLELRPNVGSKTKTFDLVAYNSAISAYEAQFIELLSGSQQFRIAISLAIGIGRYMGNTSHRVESIMIDEGFGSLDIGGRDEMVQALQALEEDFKCVIVVSHQNEFSDKFPNRYEAELVDGRTKITLV